eukprot:gene10593-3111_t
MDEKLQANKETIIIPPNDEETPKEDTQEWFSSDPNETTKFEPFDEVHKIDSKPQPSVPLNILEEGINSNYGFVAKTVLSSAYSSASNSNWFQFQFLQPYFQLDEKEVLKRLISTLKPTSMKSILQKPDFYGPIMSFFTLVTILVLSLKSGTYEFGAKAEGTLLGTSMFICFIFWITNSAILSLSQSISITGYHLFPICLIQLPNILNIHSFSIFVILFAIVGTLSVISIVKTLSTIDVNKKKISLVIAILISMIQLTFILYLRLNYTPTTLVETKIFTPKSVTPNHVTPTLKAKP